MPNNPELLFDNRTQTKDLSNTIIRSKNWFYLNAVCYSEIHNILEKEEANYDLA